MTSPVDISVSQLSKRIGLPDTPVLVDVRTDEDFETDPRLIPGAVRHPFDQVAPLAPNLEGKQAVVICHKGLKLSQGAAALLRGFGISAEVLEGGFAGWAEAGVLLRTTTALPALGHDDHTLWVTRLRPKIDRIACPWLIRRFIDPTAQFLFVEGTQVKAVAERFGAIPFDVEDVFWSHRGELCTFDVMIAEFGLSCDPLDRLATIVRAADTNRHDLAPEAAGLLAASLGLSRMYRDDLAQLEAGLVLYDAFYHWARDATTEGHDWPGGQA